jgi:hypothetical protein
MARTALALLAALSLAACGRPPPAAQVAAGRTEAPPAVALPAAPTTAGAGAGTPAGSAPAVAMPAGALYACVVDAHGERRVSAIELAPRVTALCTKNPEMGPCRYAREACRADGGRVFGPEGSEITRATEADYDRRVLRVRMQAN